MGVINYSLTARVNLQEPQAPEKTYAVVQSRGRMNLMEIAQHMADHTSPFSAGTINGVLTDLVSCSAELLCDGWILDFGALGTLKLTLESRGVCESVVDEETGVKPVFGPDDITAIHAKFNPGGSLQNLRKKVTLNRVPTRKAAAAAKKVQDALLEAGDYIQSKDSSGEGGKA